MIVSTVGGLVVVDMALIKRQDGTKIRWVKSAEEVEKYLKRNPDQIFLLEVVTAGVIIPPEVRSGHGVDQGDIACGQVKFDTTQGKVICS